MAQNQQYQQYPYYAQPQNIYQQLGKPQPQPHLQSAYQQQHQQQLVHVPQQQPYQYVYQHPQQQPQQQPQTQVIQRAPSAHGFQQPPSPYAGAPGFAPQQQVPQQQQQVYQYAQPSKPAPTPIPQAPAMYQRPPSQNSRVPVSSFPNLAPGQPMPNVLPRQIGHSATPSNMNASAQLVPAPQSLTMRGPTPAISPGPPIAPSAMFAQQVQQQHVPPLALVPAGRNPVALPVQRQIMPPPQAQTQPQPQSQPQPQQQPQPQHQLSQPQMQVHPPPQVHPPALPPPLPPRQQPQQQQQQQGIVPMKPPPQRRPLPAPGGASRAFPSMNLTANTTPASSVVTNPAVRTSITQTPTTSQPPSPIKTSTSSPTKTPSPKKTSRPLPTPGGGGGGGGSGGSGSSSFSREGFAGIGTKQSSSRVTGLSISPTISSLVADINPVSLQILPLPDGSSFAEDDSESPVKAGLPNPPSMVQTGSMTGSSNNDSLSKRRASPPRFQPSATSTPSPVKETPPSLPTVSSTSATQPSSTSSSHFKSSSISSSSSQSQLGTTSTSGNQAQGQTAAGSPTKKFTPVWKRTIPDYPQPAFGYAAGMVSDPFSSSNKPPASAANPQKQALPQSPPKPTQLDMERQRALVEQQHIERQLNAAMAQAHAQAQAQKKIAGMPVSNTSYSAYAMYSRSNPNLRQSSHVRSGAYNYEDDEDEDEGEDESDDDDSDEDEDEEEDDTEGTEEERRSRRRKHGKKASESTVTGKKKKKVTKEKDRKTTKKPKPTSRSTSAPPKKRVLRKDIPPTSEDETEATEMTAEEETEEETRYISRHVKSSSVSSSRFKAKVEKEKEVMRKKRSSQYDHIDEYYDDDDTPRKRDQLVKRREPSPPSPPPPVQQRQSFHQRNISSEYGGFPRRASPSPPPSHSGYGRGRQASPSPPPNHRVSRRVSPPRVSLLKDAQRRTVKLRGDDDDTDDRGRREEAEQWKRDERYRSRERDRNDVYNAKERYGDMRRYSGKDQDCVDDEYEYERIRQEERDLRFGTARTNGGNNGPGSLPQPTTMIRRRDADEGEDWSRSGRRTERESNKIFNLGRQDSPTRHPVRDSVFAVGYRSRPASPTRNFPQHQQQSGRNVPASTPLMSPYRSRPSSPTRPTDDRNSGLVTKFSAINIRDQGRERDSGIASGSGNREWPADLPRLPRTPGEVSNASGSGFFGARQNPSRDAHSRSESYASAEFARMSGRSGGTNDYDSGYANTARPLRRDSHNPHHYSNLDMNLDDPPPRSLSPAISQGSGPYGMANEPPQHVQPQQFNNRRPQSEVYTSTSSNHIIQRPQSHYGNMSTNPPSQPPSPVKQRPKSVFEPSRAPSVHPLDRANMNTANISNGTPKIQTITIESPAPIGGRDKRADLDRMMSDPEDEETAVPVPRTNVSRGFDGQQRRSATRDSPRGPPLIQVDEPRGPVIQMDSPRRPMIQVDSPRAPTIHIDSPRGPMIQIDSPQGPAIQIDAPRGPAISIDSPRGPTINIEPSSSHNNRHPAPKVQVYEVPGIGIAGPDFDEYSEQRTPYPHRYQQQDQQRQVHPRPGTRGGLICGGCDGPIIGRIVSAMGSRWHPQCFRCTICNELLEHVSSYEHNGRPYCHLDYHENFAPRCFSCKTAIIEERFISLDDPALGKRTYHEQHFFCAECGDPFLTPSMNSSTRTGELSVKGDGDFESDDVGFTVYRGHPYCEACHVRLRLPKCKKCKKSIRDHEQAVEALGGKWCWGCFVCASCENPFENPSFFQRGDKPYCERCFDIMLRNEI